MVSESTVPSYRFHYDKCMPAITALTQHKIVVIKRSCLSVQQHVSRLAAVLPHLVVHLGHLKPTYAHLGLS